MNGFHIKALRLGPAPPAEFAAVRGLPDVAVEPVAPGTRCLVAWSNGEPRARCTLAARDDLHGAPGLTGMIGHYEARDGSTGTALVRAAAEALAAEGCVRVLGPIDGSTWRRYRFALPSSPDDPVWDPPVFAGEPRNPFEYPDHFAAAGFTIVARYESHADDLATPRAGDDSGAMALADRVAGAGFSLRPIDLSRFDEELETLREVSGAAFAGNLYYAPVEAAEFRALYEPLRARIDPGLVSIALDRDEHPCGYLFAYPDPLAVRDGAPRRLVVKTVAVLPAARGHGLANHMLDRVRWTATRRGCDTVIHALMHVENFSMRMSARHGGRLFRRYALWQWTP